MLRSLKGVFGFTLKGKDDEFGRIDDSYIDDKEWVVRYFVADTGKEMDHKKVLIPPKEVSRPDWAGRFFPVDLKKQQIVSSPTIDEKQPVSRQYEVELHEHYGWKAYYNPGGTHDHAVRSPVPFEEEEVEREKGSGKKPAGKSDPHLRSAKVIIGYPISARDGETGMVEDFIFDDDDWNIRYIVVNTRTWLKGKKVLLSLSWVDRISWEETRVFMDVTKSTIKNGPEYEDVTRIDREYEKKLFKHYDRPGYWS